MDEKDKVYIEETIKRYQRFYNHYGNDIKSLGWKDRDKMDKRFQVLQEIGIRYEDSVLDVGCGFGDFCEMLRPNVNYVSDYDYTGIDIVPEFIEIAKNTYHFFEDFKFKQATIFDIHKKYDWIVESGIFNYKSCTMEYIRKTIDKAFKLCKKGIAFNFLTSYVDFKNVELNYTNPIIIFDYAKTLSKYVTLRHDYLDYEFTIYIYKEK